MNKTERYQLNQWDATDLILREDFNRDNVNVEQALLALDGALASEKTARVNAINQLYGTKAEKTALTALETEMHALPFVLLKNVTFNSSAAQVNVVVSDVDLSQFAYLLIIPKLTTSHSGSIVYMRLNSVSGESYYRNGNTLTYMLSAYCGSNKSVAWQIRMIPQTADGGFRCIGETVTRDGEYQVASGSVLGSTISTGALKTINFVVSAADQTILAGSKITIYGVRG